MRLIMIPGMICMLVLGIGISFSQSEQNLITAVYSPAKGLGFEEGIRRRDNSDIIKVDSLYYVWYSRTEINGEIPATVWYATSPDGHVWTEKAMCISIGEEGSWDDVACFTPGILVAGNKYYLFYTAINNSYRDPDQEKSKTRIGIAKSDSPDGPWEKLHTNPVLVPDLDTTSFDSYRVDDACVLTRNGKFWLYYKGRQWGKSPSETKMGVAFADNPEGPYVKYENNPVVDGGHEVLVWPRGEGVVAMIGTVGPSDLNHTLMYANDGLGFKKTHKFSDEKSPWAPGAYRPEAFTDSGKGQMIRWGLHLSGERPELYLERFGIVEEGRTTSPYAMVPGEKKLRVMEVNEVSFHAKNSYENPYMDVDLWILLTGPAGENYHVPAFWDGGQTFRVRLVATRPGRWSWSSGNSTGDSGLDGKSGSFDAIAWTETEKEANPNRRGFIRVAANEHTLEYADGTPFFYTADTWWCALTRIYSWGSNSGLSGISFKDAIALRKDQGFNSINIIAAFPSDTIKGLWYKGTHGEKVAEDGSTPFVIADPADPDYGVDYTQINPTYWQHADRKLHHMWENGFVPFIESVRRHEKWFDENENERKAFVNYTRYLWARFGCYNMIYSWLHCEGVDNKAMPDWKPLVNMAFDALGSMPYGQPRTAMAWGSSMTTWIVEPDAVPIGAFDIHTVSNRYRDHNMFGEFRAVYNATPTLPAANIESYYPAWGGNTPAAGLDENTMAQFMMYGSVLNGSFAGYAWGDIYYAGARPGSGEGHGHGFNHWNANTMGHLKTFVLDDGHDYRTLSPATMTNLLDTEQEWRILALNNDKSVGLGFIAANYAKTDIINLIPNTEYTLEWYNTDTGVWSDSKTVTTNGRGKLIMPDKPDIKGWAFRIKQNSEEK